MASDFDSTRGTRRDNEFVSSAGYVSHTGPSCSQIEQLQHGHPLLAPPTTSDAQILPQSTITVPTLAATI